MNFLTTGEIKSIEQVAHVLDEWRTRVIKRSFGDLGSYIPLQAVVETQVNQAIDILLTRMPALGEAVRAELDRLLRQAKLVDDLSEQDASDARVKEAELLGPVRQLISRIQQIAQSAREELGSEKPAEPEKGNVNVTIFGDVQAGNLQIAQDASIHKQTVTAEKKKGILETIGAIIAFILKILWPK